MSKIIKFPTPPNRGQFPQTEDEAASRIDDMRSLYMYDVLETAIETLIHQLSIAGFEVLDEEKDFAMLVELTKSIMAKTAGIHHPFQDLANVVMQDPDEDGFCMIANVKVTTNPQPDTMKDIKDEVQSEAGHS
jgi:hypothetical protein